MRNFLLPAIAGLLVAAALAPRAIAAQQTDADVYDVRDLFTTCSVSSDSTEYAAASSACLAFIGGAVQYHDAVSDRKHLKRLICYPAGATVSDGRAAFLAWARRHAANDERMNEIAVVGLVRALAERYPCR